MKRTDLIDALHKVLIRLNGHGSIVQICKEFWRMYSGQISVKNRLFYTWQYDIRWAATKLRKQGIMQAADISPKGIWELI